MKIKKYNQYDKALELLISLTELTIPHGKESIIYQKIQDKCNKKLNIDKFGNLYTTIGNSKLLFCAHLDTYSSEVKKVNHVIDGNYLKTDETTILGGDNKVGCAIIINMINNNIPGTYYFFVGEEVGRLGSEYHNSKIDVNDYTLALTFDRKELGSVCNYQRGMKLANDDLTNCLIQELNKTGYTFFEDQFGLSCDTFTFNEKVNNCINISTGVYDEHKKTERIDINFFKAIYNISIKINWDKIEELSATKVREKIDVNKLNIKDSKISEILNYLIDNGYNPTKVPVFDERFGIYTPKLYFKINPKIFDYFYITILKNGEIELNGNLLSKEGVIDYINDYKACLIEFKIKNDVYHVLDIDTESEIFDITLLKNNNEQINLITNSFYENLKEIEVELFSFVISLIKKYHFFN